MCIFLHAAPVLTLPPDPVFPPCCPIACLPRHTSLNRPPSGQDLLQRQDAFSARCTPLGAPWSPCADGPGTGSDDGSFSPPSATHGLRSVSVGLRDGSIEELAGYSGGKTEGEGASTVDVDSLNGMLK